MDIYFLEAVVWICISFGPTYRHVYSRDITLCLTMSAAFRLVTRPKIYLRAGRSLSTTHPRSDFHFDTHHFVQRLEREGLNRAQAEGIMAAMAEVIDESIRNMTSNMVTKAEQEKVSYSV